MNKSLVGVLCAGIFSFNLVALVFAAPGPNEAQNPPSVKTTQGKKAAVLADLNKDGLSDGLQERMAAMAEGDNIDVIVTFIDVENGKTSATAAQQAVGAFTLQREFSLIRGFKATMTVGQARALSRMPGVFRVEEDPVVTTQLAGAINDFGAIAARTNFSVGGNGVGICIVDTGIDASHEQFAGRSIGFYDAVNGIATSYDDHGHGTHVAAMALGGGGTGNNINMMGVAPAASIFVVKVLDSTGSGNGSQIIEGIQYCADQTAVQIISMSLGTAVASDGQDAMSLAVNCASSPDYSPICNITPTSPKIVVIAAGNSGPAPETVGSPGAAAKAITVGAVANWSENGKGVYLAAFSSRGPTLAGLIKPDITAPGLRILSAKAGDPAGYISFSGTSMATPFVAGAIALMLNLNSGLMDTSIPADTVRDLLFASAQDRGALDTNNAAITPDNEYGAGLLDVSRAVAAAGGVTSTSTSIPSYQRLKGHINNNGGNQIVGPFTITEADIAAGIPFAATITIEGNPICPYGSADICDILGGWEWDPDLDVYLLDDKGNIVGGGPGDITISECALSGEACGISRQETIHYLPLLSGAAGDYYLNIHSYSGGGEFLLEVSKGPMADAVTNKPPTANFTETCTALNCTFFDTSTDNDGDIISWEWNFGNGFESTLQSPVYEYLIAGEYMVTLVVTDDQGASDTTSHMISVTETSSSDNQAPVANAGGPYEATISKGKNASVSLDGTGSSDDVAITSYVWSQNGEQIGSGATASISFKEGSHTIRLTVTDDGGLIDWHETTVIILPKEGDGSSSDIDCAAKPNHPKCK